VEHRVQLQPAVLEVLFMLVDLLDITLLLEFSQILGRLVLSELLVVMEVVVV
jgi:hypothetical protein